MLKRLGLPAALACACAIAWFSSVRVGDVGVGQAEAVGVDDRTPSAPLASVRRLPEIATASLRDQRISLALDALPEPASALTCATILIDGEVMHEIGPDRALVPGHAQLFVTGLTAFDLLGADYRYETRLMAANPATDDGRIIGNLYLIGGGDPVLMSYNYSRGFRPILSTRTAIEDLADAIVDAGIVAIEGSIVGGERRYDTERTRPGWPASIIESGLSGPVSALQLDDALAERPAANGGIALPAEDPAALAAARFDDLLEARGVAISGLARSEFADEELPDLVPIVSVESPPLADILFQTWAVNDSSAAEMMLKEIGLRARSEGSADAGGEAIRDALARRGVELAVPPRDGSGLDPVSTQRCGDLAAIAASVSADDPVATALPAHDLPGVYDGAFADVELSADLRLVGGVVADSAGFVALSLDDGPRIAIATIVNRPGGPSDADEAFHHDLVAQVDNLRDAWRTVAIGEDE